MKVRCTARRTNGDPCKNAPLAGMKVCRVHGGSSPQAKSKAAERIAAAADPAAAKIIELMQNPKVPYRVQLTAARDLLDRAGLKARDTIILETKKWERSLDEVVFDMPDEDDQ
jgi:hypothetical protein